MAYFGVYIPPSKAGFEGTLAQCAGSIAAVNINVLPESVASGADDTNASKYEDPEYPPDSPLWLIFTEKSKALEVLRHYKEARLREFPNRDQAESYVQFGFESIESLKRYGKAKPASKPVSLPRMLASGPKTTVFGTTPDGIGPYSLTAATDRILTPFAPLSLANMVLSMPDSSANNTDGTASGSSASSNISLSAERPPFRAPSKQELVEFRKQIEAGNYERVKRVVWDNPRFLISSGDTPTSLKEGYRYNAMHICAQCNQARVAELILKTISERDFTQMYAGKKSSAEMCAALSENLLDYYLNMPDKGRGETPLHFAVKNGHVDVVEVLTSYPQCKSLKNTEGMQPKDIICQRAQNASPEVFKKLELLLSEPHYVPVLRSVGNELPPQVGQPFTPNDPPTLHHKCDDSGKIGMKLKISALAGPMPREQAYSFYRRWKTPPRFGGNGLPLSSSPYISPIKRQNKSLINKSVNGRRVLFSPNSNHKSEQNADDLQPIENNNNNNCTYKEGSNGTHRLLELPSSPLRQMNSLDVSSEFSLNVSAVSAMNNSFRERHIKNSDIEKGLEMIGRQLAHQEDLEWREYWDFLDDFVDISSNNGIARLESYLAGKSDQAQASLLAEKTDQAWNFSQMHQYFDLIADRGKTNVNASTAGIAITQVMTPYTCVEKSLQVFAKRITKTLINNIGNMVSINDTLLSELKRLKSLIVSFKDDARFITVDFTKVHSRIAHLVASYIAHSQEVSTALRYQLMQMLRKLLQLTGERREHLQCVCGSMLPMLDQVPVVQLPDALKTEELCSSAWDMELCCKCLWDANLSRKTSRRKRTESLRAQAQELGNAASTSAAAAATLADAAAQCNPDSLNDSFVTVFANCSITDNNNVDDDRDDDTFFYDCGDAANDDNSSDDEAIFMTPPESRSPRISCSEAEPRYELFIFGKEPTKRDLDVLNAIFNVEVDKETHPFVFAWRAAMESFTTEEMDLFPSPTNIQKSNKSSFFNITRTPNAMQTNSPSSNSSIPDNSSITHVKKLIATPKLNAAAMFRHLGITSTPPKLPWPSTPPRAAGTQNGVKKQETSTPIDTPSPASPFPTVAVTSDHQTVIVSSVTQTFQTPLDKMRGLFTKYREIRREDSPTAFSPKSLSGRLNLSISLDESD